MSCRGAAMVVTGTAEAAGEAGTVAVRWAVGAAEGRASRLSYLDLPSSSSSVHGAVTVTEVAAAVPVTVAVVVLSVIGTKEEQNWLAFRASRTSPQAWTLVRSSNLARASRSTCSIAVAMAGTLPSTRAARLTLNRCISVGESSTMSFGKDWTFLVSRRGAMAHMCIGASCSAVPTGLRDMCSNGLDPSRQCSGFAVDFDGRANAAEVLVGGCGAMRHVGREESMPDGSSDIVSGPMLR